MEISPLFETLSGHCDISDVDLPFPGHSIIWNGLRYLWMPQAEETYVIFETDVKNKHAIVESAISWKDPSPY
jgi:hypothetical protein